MTEFHIHIAIHLRHFCFIEKGEQEKREKGGRVRGRRALVKVKYPGRVPRRMTGGRARNYPRVKGPAKWTSSAFRRGTVWWEISWRIDGGGSWPPTSGLELS